MELPPLPDELRSASGAELVSAAYRYLEPIFRGLSQAEEDRALPALPVPLRDMWVLHWLDFEVTRAGNGWPSLAER